MPLALVGLVDLFERAARRRGARVDPDDAFARGRAVLAALRRARRARPGGRGRSTTCSGSTPRLGRALRYALRRLDAEPVGAARDAHAAPASDDPLGAGAPLRPGRCETLDLGPLDLDELRRVLAGRSRRSRGRRCGGSTRSRAATRSTRSSSPAALAGRTRASAAGGLPLPDSLRAAIARRLDDVPPELDAAARDRRRARPATAGRRLARDRCPEPTSRRAARARPTRDELLVVDERPRGALLAPAARLRRLRPDEPARAALRSTRRCAARPPTPTCARATSRSRRTSPTPRPRRCSRRPPSAPRRRGAVGARGRVRGAQPSALTPAGDADARAPPRARARSTTSRPPGEAGRALALADRLVAGLPAGPRRAEALIQPRLSSSDDDLETGEALLAARARRRRRDDALLRGRVLDMLGWLRACSAATCAAGIACADARRSRSPTRCGDVELQMRAAGRPRAHARRSPARRGPTSWSARSTLEERASASPRARREPARAGSAKHRLWAGDLPRPAGAAPRPCSPTPRAPATSCERPYRLYDLALLECAAGDLASRRGARAPRASRPRATPRTPTPRLAAVPARRSSRLARPRRRGALARPARCWSGRRGAASGRPWSRGATSVLGLLALVGGRRGGGGRRARRGGAPCSRRWASRTRPRSPILPDAVEALARAGDRPAAAGALLDAARAAGARPGSAWARGRGRARRAGILLRSARRAGDGVEAAAARPPRASTALGYRPDAARARARAGPRAAARRAAARRPRTRSPTRATRFAAMGAALWEARAAEELERAVAGPRRAAS